MALVKCPDCGKLVSDRAAICPVCGCPADFFENAAEEEASNTDAGAMQVVDTKTDTAEAESEKEEIAEETESTSKSYIAISEAYREFTLFETTIRYEESQRLYIDTLKRHNKEAAVSERKFRKLYDEVGAMDKVWQVVVPEMDRKVAQMLEENIKSLYQAGIKISREEFEKKYHIDFWATLEEVMNAYNDLVKDANELQRLRQLERAGRSQWTGGGFGLSGAIKGAVQAGALNAVTGVGRAIGDSAVDSGDRAQLEAEKQKIYNDQKYQKQIFEGFRRCIQWMDFGTATEYINAGYTRGIGLDEDAAWNQSLMAAKYEDNKNQLVRIYVDSISKLPLCLTFYVEVKKWIIKYGASDKDIDQFMALIKFWDMDKEESLDSLCWDYDRCLIIREYIKEHPEVEEIDFSQYDVATYIKVRDAKLALENVLFSKTKEKQLPTMNRTSQGITEYYKVCSDRLDALDMSIIRDLKQNDSGETYAKKIHKEKVILPDLLKGVWVYGDEDKVPEKKLKTKWMLPETEPIVMYQNKAIFGTVFGGDGFVLTRSVLCDLKSKMKINIQEIKQVRYEPESCAVVVEAGNSNITVDVKDEKKMSRVFLYHVLKDYVGHMKNIKDGLPSDIKMESGSNEMQDTQVNSAKAKQENSMMFCVSCGNKIPRNAKFCTYCGATNEYSNNTKEA